MLDDEEADDLVQQYTAGYPERGERMIIGMVRANTNASFTRAQVRSSIQRVDEVGVEARREAFGRRLERYMCIFKVFNCFILLITLSYSPYVIFNSRRVYNVKGPHHLWHNDGHHKLIRYGLVTHGCVDGNTRTIIYLGKTTFLFFKTSFGYYISFAF